MTATLVLILGLGGLVLVGLGGYVPWNALPTPIRVSAVVIGFAMAVAGVSLGFVRLAGN